MTLATGFPPLTRASARVLILGSMPGAESLRQRQYYAYKHNVFWRIMGELFGAGPELAYAERVKKLTAQGVAVWDVLKRCERPGSLDASIRRDSEVANDFETYLQEHPRVRAVFFNGSKSQQAFRQHVAPLLRTQWPHLHYERLPSTSPAHAGKSFAHKLERWQRIKDFL